MSQNDGLQVPARPRRKVPESDQIARDRAAWVATGSHTEPVKEKRVRMTFRTPQSLQKRFKIAAALRDEDPSKVLCDLMEVYIDAQDISPATIRRALAAE